MDEASPDRADADLDARLRAGVALYTAGRYRAAHDPWEAAWHGSTGDDDPFLHGLVQFTAAVHHGLEANREGATGLARSAEEYLAGLPPRYRGIDLDPIRAFLPELERDPVTAAEEPPELRYEGRRLSLSALEFPAARHAAAALAEDLDGYDEAIAERAGEYALADLDAGRATTPFVALLLDFVDPGEVSRALVYARLESHVEKRDAEAADVDGLFEAE
jgi:predicted metal-dependent hydrolase